MKKTLKSRKIIVLLVVLCLAMLIGALVLNEYAQLNNALDCGV